MCVPVEATTIIVLMTARGGPDRSLLWIAQLRERLFWTAHSPPASHLAGGIAASTMTRPSRSWWSTRGRGCPSLAPAARQATMAGGLQEVRPLAQHRARVDTAGSTARAVGGGGRGAAAGASGRRTW